MGVRVNEPLGMGNGRVQGVVVLQLGYLGCCAEKERLR